MSQAVKQSSPTFIWWATYVAVFVPFLSFRVVREMITPVFDGWGDWAKAVAILLFLCVFINAPTANIATGCLGHPKEAKYAARWSALVACGISLALWLIVAGFPLFWLSVLYALVTGITVGITVHCIARKIQSEQ